MQNLFTLTEFVRALKGKPMGFNTIYLTPEGKSYGATCKGLTAVSLREGVTISASKTYVVDPATLKTLEAIKVTVK